MEALVRGWKPLAVAAAGEREPRPRQPLLPLAPPAGRAPSVTAADAAAGATWQGDSKTNRSLAPRPSHTDRLVHRLVHLIRPSTTSNNLLLCHQVPTEPPSHHYHPRGSHPEAERRFRDNFGTVNPATSRRDLRAPYFKGPD